jgi:hypothetical protein
MPGTYLVIVWAREAGSTAAYEATSFTTYQLTVLSCASVTMGANPASPQAAGTLITFTAATSSGCTSPQYEFWEQLPGGAWKLLRSFEGVTSFGWDSTGTTTGEYRFALWAVASGSNNVYDSYALRTVSVS